MIGMSDEAKYGILDSFMDLIALVSMRVSTIDLGISVCNPAIKQSW